MALHSPNILALGAGGCGIELGIKLVLPEARIVGYVEREAFAAANLAAKIEEGVLDEAPIWADVADFDGAAYRGHVDLVSVGIPCQPFSTSGKQQGTKDKRWIWPAIWRIVRAVGAEYLFVEEVPPFVQHALPLVLGDLAACGWDAEWDLFSAEAMGAPEERRRVFLLARSNTALGNAGHDAGRTKQGRKREMPPGELGGAGEGLAESECHGLDGPRLSVPSGRPREAGSDACGTGEEMADTAVKPEREPNDETRSEPWQDSWPRSCRRRKKMADTDNARLEGSRLRGSGCANERVAGSRRSALADSDGSRRWAESNRSDSLGTASTHNEVADSQRSRQRKNDGGSQGGQSDSGSRCQVFPPGPGLGGDGVISEIRKLLGRDPLGAWERYQAELATTLRWAEILRDDPSVEPAYGRVAGRTSGEVDRIRLCGNGVVPVVAGVAFVILGRRLEGN